MLSVPESRCIPNSNVVMILFVRGAHWVCPSQSKWLHHNHLLFSEAMWLTNDVASVEVLADRLSLVHVSKPAGIRRDKNRSGQQTHTIGFPPHPTDKVIPELLLSRFTLTDEKSTLDACRSPQSQWGWARDGFESVWPQKDTAEHSCISLVISTTCLLTTSIQVHIYKHTTHIHSNFVRMLRTHVCGRSESACQEVRGL